MNRSQVHSLGRALCLSEDAAIDVRLKVSSPKCIWPRTMRHTGQQGRNGTAGREASLRW